MSSSTSERKRYHKDDAPTDDNLTLINLVRQNPALYNYKLKPNQRRRSDVLNGWKEVAQQIGNKYTVQEVRRKWKNLRDTYHQYRLRTPRCIGGRLSKWRYAKELDFLSTVYQPKLKSHRTNQSSSNKAANGGEGGGPGSASNNSLPSGAMLHLKQHDDDYGDDEVVDDDGQSDHYTATLSSHRSASQITLVSHEAKTCIRTAYEEGVADDEDYVVDHDGHVVDIVKHELDEDGATGAEVDYEEVSLYEEAIGAHVDCEMGVGDFCISDIEPQSVRSNQHQVQSAPGSVSNSVLSGGTVKNLTLITTTAAGVGGGVSSNRHDSSSVSTQQISLVDVTEATSTTTPAAALCNTTSLTSASTATILQLPSLSCGSGNGNGNGNGPPLAVSAASSSTNNLVKEEELHRHQQAQQVAQALAKRDELDLFFDFLKKKMQCFSKTQITHIQMEFLNCVSRQESADQDGKD